ncbi:hypothetical protein BGZ46_008023 [Entomortierella lignicola]|nr:hypothetical protein BGZ46_008023 [Entomortierella lignicola]
MTRGLSADSSSTQEMDRKSRDASGSANSSFSRKATAKDRLIAIVTRNSGTSAPPSASTEVVSGPCDIPAPRSFPEGIEERSSPRTGRPILLNHTQSKRHGSPTISRSGFNDYTATTPNSSGDGMIGFPYNNSSLLLSTSRMTSNLRPTRQSKPRPFSIATMEKVSEPGGKINGDEQKQEPLRHEKLFLSQGRQDSQDRQDYQSSRHQQPANVDQTSVNGNTPMRPRMIGSCSHPILSTLSSFHGKSVYPAEGINEQGSEGKGIEQQDHDISPGVKPIDSKRSSQPILEGFSNSNGPLQVLEQHIHHHHYYCHHCPPPNQSGTAGMEPEQHYSTVIHRRRPDSTPLVYGSAQLPRRHSILDERFSTSPTETIGGQFALQEDNSNDVKPLVAKKKKSILGTMSMTSSMRKRFFAEQKKDQVQPTIQTHGTQRRLSIPFFSNQSSKYEEEPSSPMYHKDRPYGLAGATIRTKKSQKQIPLDELSDEEDEFGTASTPPSENNSHQQRAKFLSRLKKFLLKPSPSAKNPDVSQEAIQSTAIASTRPILARSAATVRAPKSRWSRSGNNLLVHFNQDDIDSEDYSSEAMPVFPARQRTVRRWTQQDMYYPPTSTLQRRERIDIRTQFQQSSPSNTQYPLQYQQQQQQQQQQYHHHHHHHHDPISPLEHQLNHSTMSKQNKEQRPLSQRHTTSSSFDMITAATTPSDDPKSVDFDNYNDRRLPKSPVTSTLSSLPMSTMNDKDFSDHDTTPTTCSTSPVATKPVETTSSPLQSINAMAL